MAGEVEAGARVKPEEAEAAAEVIDRLFVALTEFLRELPGMLRNVLEVLYDKELAKKSAESFAAFYKTLVEQGFSEEEALSMAKKYYEDSLSVRSVLKLLEAGKVVVEREGGATVVGEEGGS